MKKFKKVILSLITLLLFFGMVHYLKAESKIIDNKVYWHNLLIIEADINTFKELNSYYAKDKNNVYAIWYDRDNIFYELLKGADINSFQALKISNMAKDKNHIYCSGPSKFAGRPYTIDNADALTFEILGEYYAKDKDNIYYIQNWWGQRTLVKLAEADFNSFEVLTEDESYALDNNNMYRHGKILNESGNVITNTYLYNQLKGKIILKVEKNGEAYYVSPNKKAMYYLSLPLIAFYVMRNQGIGITNENLEKIPAADNYCPSYMPNCDKKSKHNLSFANMQNGKIFLQVEKNGEAWYIYPANGKRYFLGRPNDAFNIMRNLGLGISNSNFDSLIK